MQATYKPMFNRQNVLASEDNVLNQQQSDASKLKKTKRKPGPKKTLPFDTCFPSEYITKLSRDTPIVTNIFDAVRDNWQHIPDTAKANVPYYDIGKWLRWTRSTTKIYNNVLAKGVVLERDVESAWRGVFISILWGHTSYLKGLPELWRKHPSLREIKKRPEIMENIKANLETTAVDQLAQQLTTRAKSTDVDSNHGATPRPASAQPTIWPSIPQAVAPSTHQQPPQGGPANSSGEEGLTGVQKMLKRRAEEGLDGAPAKKPNITVAGIEDLVIWTAERHMVETQQSVRQLMERMNKVEAHEKTIRKLKVGMLRHRESISQYQATIELHVDTIRRLEDRIRILGRDMDDFVVAFEEFQTKTEARIGNVESWKHNVERAFPRGSNCQPYAQFF